MIAIIVAIVACLFTLLGGLFALRFRSHLHLIMGFTAGVLLGLVVFDLLPEIFDELKGHDIDVLVPMGALIVGFLAFHTIEKLISASSDSRSPRVGIFSALALSGHSFVDGLGIGLGFQVSETVGIVVAVAVLAHDFADGLNTAALMLVHHNSAKRAASLVALDAVAPILGVLASHFVTLNPTVVVIYLGFFAGFLLYIGASDVLPEAYRQGANAFTPLLTIGGAVFALIVTYFS